MNEHKEESLLKSRNFEPQKIEIQIKILHLTKVLQKFLRNLMNRCLKKFL